MFIYNRNKKLNQGLIITLILQALGSLIVFINRKSLHRYAQRSSQIKKSRTQNRPIKNPPKIKMNQIKSPPKI
jgi:hypothetical protein